MPGHLAPASQPSSFRSLCFPKQRDDRVAAFPSTAGCARCFCWSPFPIVGLVLPSSFHPTLAPSLAKAAPEVSTKLPSSSSCRIEGMLFIFLCKQANSPEPSQVKRELELAVGLSSTHQLMAFPFPKSKKINMKESPGSHELSGCLSDSFENLRKGTQSIPGQIFCQMSKHSSAEDGPH